MLSEYQIEQFRDLQHFCTYLIYVNFKTIGFLFINNLTLNIDLIRALHTIVGTFKNRTRRNPIRLRV